MSMPIIMVQIADRKWTLEALHRACALARDVNAEIVLLTMLPV
jgi:nucleotide-binding universal stress UspA family protein